MKKVAVAGGDNLTMLQACRKAKDLKIAECILFGISKKIKDMASANNLDISDFEIIEEPIDSQCAMSAAEYVREGKADIYAKGSLETKYLSHKGKQIPPTMCHYTDSLVNHETSST